MSRASVPRGQLVLCFSAHSRRVWEVLDVPVLMLLTRAQLVGTDLETGSMPTITTTHLGKPQDAAATSKAAPEQHEDHGPLWDGVIHPLRLHISVAHEMSSAASPAPSLLNCSGTFPSGTAQSMPGSGQDQGQGASRGTGSPGRILQGQNQPLAGKPIPRSPTHFPAVWTGTAFAPHANLSLCCKSPPPSHTPAP